jgi:hypothetical protein
MNVPHADRDHSEIPTVPEGEVAGCQVCPAELADTRGGWLEHHDDGSHTYHPEAVAWELEDGRVDEPIPFVPVVVGLDGSMQSLAEWARGPEPDPAEPPAVIDAAHIERQRAWSRETFGPGTRTAGVLDHIRRELDEVQAAPGDVTEWADVVILAFDGAWRAGHEPQAILDAIVAKQARNETRTWPDWRTADPNRAIEHVRQPEA